MPSRCETSKPRANAQMFALRQPPPSRLELAGRAYELARVFKHDFLAATCLYRCRQEGADLPEVVVKFHRRQDFWGLPLDWAGRALCDHEQAIYRRLAGLEGVPRWVSRIDDVTYAIQYIPALPLDHLDAPPPGFFDRLRALLGAVHARGVGYGDANKRSNILVGRDGQAFLVDYQLAIGRRDDLPWPWRTICAALVRYIAAKDLYHLYKHKRRLCPQEMTAQELSRRRGGLHWLHRKLTKPYRAVRRWFLRDRFRKGMLVSPTQGLEDHHQPEKATWRG